MARKRKLNKRVVVLLAAIGALVGIAAVVVFVWVGLILLMCLGAAVGVTA